MSDSFPPSAVPLTPLPGSERPAAPGAAPSPRTLSADDLVEATLVLRRRAPLELDGAVRSRKALAEAAGADPRDLATVSAVLTPLGFETVAADAASRRVRIRGTVANAERAFGTSLELVRSAAPDGRDAEHRHRIGSLSVPSELAGIVTAVLGLDDRPQSRTQWRAARAATASHRYTPVQLGAIYDFPAGTDGGGQTVAIVELGGGFGTADLATYFRGLGVGSPSVTAVPVDGARNEPGADPDGADGEVLLDIEVVGALAPAAKVLVYFAPNTDAGFLDAVADAAHADPAPAAISISWGQSEDQWTAQARAAMDDAFQDAAALGVTVAVAAGDNGSGDGEKDGEAHVDFPASSPHALACGGTRLVAVDGVVQSETVWNDGSNGGATGGGVSRTFPLPAWQAHARVPKAPTSAGGRGVPDVSANADPETGYEILVDGRRITIGGTSAVAPLWAALIARLVQSLGQPLGLLHPKLYAAASGFRDVTSGNNGDYAAGPGWDACTGLGVPQGTALLQALQPR